MDCPNEIASISGQRSFYDLPDEIILHIFSYLPLPDRKSTKLVCHRWNRLNYDTNLIKNDVTVISNYSEFSNFVTSENLHKIFNLRIEIDKTSPYNLFSQEYLPFWTQHGRYINSIVLKFLDHGNITKILADIFKYCVNLEHLTLWYEVVDILPCECEQSLSINTSNLKSLVLLEIPCFEVLNCLLRTALNLECLNLRYYKYEFDNPLFKSLLNFLQKSNLKSFCFECAILSSLERNSRLHDFVTKVGLKITEFLPFEHNVENESSIRVLRGSLNNLRKFSVCKFYQGNYFSSDLVSFLSELTKLTYLSIDNIIRPLNHESINLLNSLMKNLTNIEIFNCKFSNEVLLKLFSEETYPKVKTFSLSSISTITDLGLKVIFYKLPNVQFIYIKDCKRLSTKSLKFISFYCKNLRLLSIRDCFEVEYINWTYYLNSLQKLESLNIINSPLLHTDFRKFKSVNLKHIVISAFKYIPQDDRRIIFENCPKLQYILKYAYGVTNNSPFGWPHRAINRNLEEKVVLYWLDRIWKDEIPCVTSR